MPERAPDSQRERIIDGQALALVERLAKLDLMDLADCNTAVRIIADALLVAREGDGYESIANGLVRELTTARERIAELEEALGRGCGVCCAVLGPPASDPAPTAGRPALDYGVHAGLNTGFASGCAATWEELQDGKCHEPGHWTPPTAGRNAPETCWLIERAIDGVPHWLAWRDRNAISWTPNAHEADRYDWSIAASREARLIAATQGIACQAIEHQFPPPDPRPRGR